MTTAPPMVKAEAVHKSFGHVEVLKGIDLEVQPGEVVCMHRAVRFRASRRSCVASTTSRRSTPGRLWVDGELVGYRQVGDKLHELRDAARSRGSGPRSGWCSSGSTSSRT